MSNEPLTPEQMEIELSGYTQLTVNELLATQNQDGINIPGILLPRVPDIQNTPDTTIFTKLLVAEKPEQSFMILDVIEGATMMKLEDLEDAIKNATLKFALPLTLTSVTWFVYAANANTFIISDWVPIEGEQEDESRRRYLPISGDLIMNADAFLHLFSKAVERGVFDEAECQCFACQEKRQRELLGGDPTRN